MPKSPPSACTTPGCAELVQPGTGSKCPAHKKESRAEYKADPMRAQLEAFYTSKVWRAVSKHQRKKEPLCAICLSKGVYTPAAVADHIVEVKDNWELRLTASNLQSLCIPCNTKKGADAKKKRTRYR